MVIDHEKKDLATLPSFEVCDERRKTHVPLSSDSIIRSWIFGRKSRIAWLSRRGCTGLESNDIALSRSGSVQIDGPVKPRWPSADSEQGWPGLGHSAAGVARPGVS